MLFLVALSACVATVLGGLFALRLRDRLHLILGFSAGAVIGVAFFDLIPEALDLAGAAFPIPTVTSVIALGFAAYLIFDRVVIMHHCHEEGEHEHAVRGIWGAATLALHSFLDGLAIGFAFQVSQGVGLVVTAAVLAHDFSDGINTVSMILKNGGNRARALTWLAIDAIAPVLGIFSTFLFSVSESQLGLLLAVFSGFFLYIGASDLLPESHHSHPKYWTTVATVLGLIVLYAAIHFAA